MSQESALPVAVIGGVIDSIGRIVSVVVDANGMDCLEASGIRKIFYFNITHFQTKSRKIID